MKRCFLLPLLLSSLLLAEDQAKKVQRLESDKQTIGLLQRLHVRILKTTYIGKESNKIEDVASALVHSAQDVYTEYPDPRRDEWESTIRPALNKVQPERVAEMTGLSVRTIIYARTGTKRPHAKHQKGDCERSEKTRLDLKHFDSSRRAK